MIQEGALSQNDNGCSRANMRSKSNTKQTQFLLTLNTKIVFLAPWPRIKIAIGYGALAVAIFTLNHPVSGADELSCWQNGKCLFWLDGIPNCI